MYKKEIGKLLPQIDKLQKDKERKDLINQRIIMEYKYLRKKDYKLEKYFRQAKNDLNEL